MATRANEEDTPENGDAPLIDLNDASVKKLLAKAKRRGFLTYDELNAALPQDLLLDLPLTMQPPNQAEDLVMTISNIWFANAGGTMIPASPSYGPVTKWKRLAFTPAELLDPVISGDARDPEHDGLPNLVEMLLAGRAKVADPAKVPALGAQLNPQDSRWYLTLTYRRSKTAQGVAGEVQASTDLKTWPVVVPSVPTGVQDATTIEMKASVVIDGQSQFLRLRAKRTGSP